MDTEYNILCMEKEGLFRLLISCTHQTQQNIIKKNNKLNTHTW